VHRAVELLQEGDGCIKVLREVKVDYGVDLTGLFIETIQTVAEGNGATRILPNIVRLTLLDIWVVISESALSEMIVIQVR